MLLFVSLYSKCLKFLKILELQNPLLHRHYLYQFSNQSIHNPTLSLFLFKFHPPPSHTRARNLSFCRPTNCNVVRAHTSLSLTWPCKTSTRKGRWRLALALRSSSHRSQLGRAPRVRFSRAHDRSPSSSSSSSARNVLRLSFPKLWRLLQPPPPIPSPHLTMTLKVERVGCANLL